MKSDNRRRFALRNGCIYHIIYSIVYRGCANDYVNIIISIDDNYNIIIVFNKPTSRRSSIYYLYSLGNASYTRHARHYRL